MIDKIKEGGFKTVRIPVSWGEHMGEAPEYTVDEAWLNRVKEVVDYCIDNGLYAIINVHHYNEVALKAIRATGDNNVDRSVMIPTYAASGSSTDINSLKLPEDKHIIVSLHAYSPYFFAMDTSAGNLQRFG